MRHERRPSRPLLHPALNPGLQDGVWLPEVEVDTTLADAWLRLQGTSRWAGKWPPGPGWDLFSPSALPGQCPGSCGPALAALPRAAEGIQCIPSVLSI